MNNMNFWEITKTQKTDDLSEVKNIYDEYLKVFENDRISRMTLKDAYNEVRSEIMKKINMQVECIIDYIDTLYQDTDKRFNEKVWDEMFYNMKNQNNEFFFDYFRNEFLGYLLNHMYFSNNIWKIFDKYFYIEQDYEQLKTNFPITFLNRVKQILNGDALFEYERIKKVSKNPKIADEYISELFELGDMIEYGAPFGDIENKIEKLKQYGYYHICFDVECMNYYVKSGRNNNEISELCEMFADEKNPYIAACVANALRYLGNADKADYIYLNILDEYPEYLKALLGHARYLFESCFYEQAKDYVFDIIDTVGDDDEVMALLKEINDAIIPNYQELYEENPDDGYNAIQYAWCLCQNEEWNDVIDVLSDTEDNEFISYDLNMLLGRAYFSTSQYDLASEYLQKWVKNMMLLPCDGTEEYKEKIERYPAALAILAENYYEMNNITQAIYYMEQSMHAYGQTDSERIKSIIRLADFYNIIGEYEKAFSLSEEAVKIDDCCIWGYVAHQKAAFELKKSEDVIQDYVTISTLAADYEGAYIYAAWIYLYSEMYDGLHMLLKRADSNGIYDENLFVMKLIVLANKVRDADLTKLEQDFKKASESLNPDKRLYSIMYKCLSNRYKTMGKYKKAEEYIDKAIYFDEENLHLIWKKALLLDEFDTKSALRLYEDIYEDMKDDIIFLCDFSLCLLHNREWERYVEIFNDVQLDECRSVADMSMMYYYKYLFDESSLTEHYEKARMYIDRFIAQNPDDMNAVSERLSLAMMTDDVDICDTAIEDGEILLMSNDYLPNEIRKMLALLYIRKGEAEKAIEKSEQIENDEETSPGLSRYSILAKAYQRLNRIDISEKTMRKAYKKTGEPYYAKKIADYNAELGNFSMAIRWYHKYEDLTAKNMCIEISRVHYMSGDVKKAHKIRDDVFVNIKKATADTARDIAWHMFIFCDNTEKAILYMERAAQFSNENGLIDAYSALALFYRAVNDDKHAVKYAKKLFEIMTAKHDGMLEGYLNVSYGLRDRLDNVALYYIGMNQFDVAEKYLKKMMHGDYLCAWCSEPCCSDAYIRLAQLKMIQGDYDGMANVCHKLLEKDSSNQIARIYLKKAEEMKNENNS